jgi:hypothetical protein
VSTYTYITLLEAADYLSYFIQALIPVSLQLKSDLIHNLSPVVIERFYFYSLFYFYILHSLCLRSLGNSVSMMTGQPVGRLWFDPW